MSEHRKAIEEFVESICVKIERTTRALVEENVMTEGGLVSAAKTYAKALIELTRALYRNHAVIHCSIRYKCLDLIDKAIENCNKAMPRLSEYAQKRVQHLIRHLKWLRNNVDNTPCSIV